MTSQHKTVVQQNVVMKPNIQNYHDYIEFLKDWTEYLKLQDDGFSLRKLAKQAGIASVIPATTPTKIFNLLKIEK